LQERFAKGLNYLKIHIKGMIWAMGWAIFSILSVRLLHLKYLMAYARGQLKDAGRD